MAFIDLKICSASRGQCMGFEDVLNERPYTTTVRCISTTGTVYCINKTNFFEKCKKDEKSYKKLFKVSDDMDIKT